jgi:hypothetical protein
MVHGVTPGNAAAAMERLVAGAVVKYVYTFACMSEESL